MHSLNTEERTRFFELVTVLEETPETKLVDWIEGLEAQGESPTVVASLRAAARLPLAPAVFVPGQRIGGKYTIVEEVAHGGMGIVYKSTQDRTRQVVALKMIHPAVATGEMVKLMNEEISILGQLEHPGIVRIFDADLHRDEKSGYETLFYVMEFVEGRPLTTGGEERSRSVFEALEIFVKVCDAVQFAHEHGVLHCDLKPNNILLKADGTPRVLDFGLGLSVPNVSRGAPPCTAGAAAARTALAGTPAYMAPEQFDPDPAAHAPDVATDVYSLGLILFELLTGRLPHAIPKQASPTAVSEIKRGQPPLRLRDCLPECEPALDLIVAKALDPDPVRRHASAGALACDVREHLADVRGRTRRRMRRILALAGAGALSLIVLGAMWMNRRIGLAESRADLGQLGRANLQDARGLGRGVAILDAQHSRYPAGVAGWRDEAARLFCASDWSAPASWLSGAPLGFAPIAYDEAWNAAVGADGDGVLWLAFRQGRGPGQKLPPLPEGQEARFGVVARDGAVIGLAMTDGRVALRRAGADGWHIPVGPRVTGRALAVSHDGRYLAFGGSVGNPAELKGNVVMVECGTLRGTGDYFSDLTSPGPPKDFVPGSREPFAVAFSPDDKLLAVSSLDSLYVLVWETATHRLAGHLYHRGEVRGIAWKPDAGAWTLASACADGSVYVADCRMLLPVGEKPQRLDFRASRLPPADADAPDLLDVAWVPGSGDVASLDADGKLVMWNPTQQSGTVPLTGLTPSATRLLAGPARELAGLATVAPTGAGPASGRGGAFVRWEIRPSAVRVVRPLGAPPTAFGWEPSGASIVVAVGGSVIQLDSESWSPVGSIPIEGAGGVVWRAGESPLAATIDGPVWCDMKRGQTAFLKKRAVSPRAECLVTASLDGAWLVWSQGDRVFVGRTELASSNQEFSFDGKGRVVALAVAPSGEIAVVRVAESNAATLWHRSPGQSPVSRGSMLVPEAIGLTADSRFLVTVQSNGLVCYDAASGSPAKGGRPTDHQPGLGPALALSPLEAGVGAVAAGEGRVALIAIPSGDVLVRLHTGDSEPVVALAFSADGSSLAAGTRGGLAVRWNIGRLRQRLARYALDWGPSMAH